MALTKEEAEKIAYNLEAVVGIMEEVRDLCLASLRENGHSHAAAQLLDFTHEMINGNGPDTPGKIAFELRKQIPTLK